MRGALSTLLAACAMALPIGNAAVAAEPGDPAPFDGAMSFVIPNAAAPEEYRWRLLLGEDQTLQLVSDQQATVSYKDHVAYTIVAQGAHAADGAGVPTSLAVVGGDVIALTVHHKGGNQAAGGAPFAYPILPGEGWEGGFQTHIAEMPPPETTGSPSALNATRPCIVPRLKGRTLRSAREKLKKVGCRLGPVRGVRASTPRVRRQWPVSGKQLAPGASVAVRVN